MTLSEVMTKNPKTCAPKDFVQQAAQLMKSEDVGPIPIVGDNGKLEGIIMPRHRSQGGGRRSGSKDN